MTTSPSHRTWATEASTWILGPPALLVLVIAALRLLDPRELTTQALPRVDHAVAGLLAAFAAAALLWHLASLAAARLAIVRLLPDAARSALAAWVRRSGTAQARRLLARHGAGAALGLGLAAGALSPSALADPSPVPDDLTWGSAVSIGVDLAVSGTSPATAAPSPGPVTRAQGLLSENGRPGKSSADRPTDHGADRADRTDGGSARLTHTVTSGETLWDITRSGAGPAATDADIARLWPTLHAANAAVIGPDPDLIVPGQVLEIPEDLR